jgi:Acyl-CoA dehydrogenase, C-terminal domain
VAAAGDVARKALADGAVVTSVPPGPAGPTVVGWGAQAALVVDQGDGSVLADGPLPGVGGAYDLPHGWYDRPAASAGPDPLRARRWLLSAAASAGLAAGALQATVRYAKEREQFGRPLSSFQALQMRMAESLHLLERCELMVRDAAWRMGEGRADGPVSAALAWLFVAPSVKTITGHAHQVYGALGFATETGLFRATSQAQWLRLATPSKDAARFVMARRTRAPGVPPSQVLTGFTHDPDPA